jgi:dihydroxyacetone kinase-like protein
MNDLRKSTRRLNSSSALRLTSGSIRRWMEVFAMNIADAEPQLTELDCAIGDGDHGFNMRRGVHAVTDRLDELDLAHVSGQLRLISMTFMSSVGGASGPLYGAFFLESSHSTLHKTDLSLSDLTAALESGCRGVVQLGKAAVGDKTMVDSLAAAVVSLRASCGRHESFPEALENCRRAVLKAAEGTIPMIAKKGRASYLGARSAGVQDPGATSASLLFDALAEVVSSLSSTLSAKTPSPVLL